LIDPILIVTPFAFPLTILVCMLAAAANSKQPVKESSSTKAIRFRTSHLPSPYSLRHCMLSRFDCGSKGRRRLTNW
jgi:hypothetical protein